MVLMWYNPFYKKLKLNGPWVVYVYYRQHPGWSWKHYMPTFRVAWKHAMVSLGFDDYRENDTETQ